MQTPKAEKTVRLVCAVPSVTLGLAIGAVPWILESLSFPDPYACRFFICAPVAPLITEYVPVAQLIAFDPWAMFIGGAALIIAGLVLGFRAIGMKVRLLLGAIAAAFGTCVSLVAYAHVVVPIEQWLLFDWESQTACEEAPQSLCGRFEHREPGEELRELPSDYPSSGPNDYEYEGYSREDYWKLWLRPDGQCGGYPQGRGGGFRLGTWRAFDNNVEVFQGSPDAQIFELAQMGAYVVLFDPSMVWEVCGSLRAGHDVTGRGNLYWIVDYYTKNNCSNSIWKISDRLRSCLVAHSLDIPLGEKTILRTNPSGFDMLVEIVLSNPLPVWTGREFSVVSKSGQPQGIGVVTETAADRFTVGIRVPDGVTLPTSDSRLVSTASDALVRYDAPAELVGGF